MKKLILIILSAISFQAISQEFAPTGALWHFDQYSCEPGVITFQTFESISETIINGKPCKEITRNFQLYCMPATEYLYMYSSNDSVFFYKGNHFHLLYVFSASTGDTITLGYYTTYNGLPLKMVIDSTSTISINGQTRKVQYVTCGDGMTIEFGGIVIEGIGNTTFMFPRFDSSMDGDLRCYKDPSLGSFINPYYTNNGWNFQDCEQVITAIPESEMNADIMIYPIPTTDYFVIKNIYTPTEFKFFNVHGIPVKSGIANPSQVINVNDLSSGLYFLEIRNSKLCTIKKIIKK